MSALLVVVLLGIGASTTLAQPEAGSMPQGEAELGSPEAEARAREAFLAGLDAYENGRFEEALDRFEAAFRLTVPERRIYLLVNLGLVLDKLGREEEALQRFEQYLELAPDGPNAAMVRGRVRVLRRRLASRREREAALQASLRRGDATRAPRRAEETTGKGWVWAAVGGGVLVVVGAAVAVALLGGGGGDGPTVRYPAGAQVEWTVEAVR